MAQEQLTLLLIEHDAAFARYLGEMLWQARELTGEVVVAENLQSGLCALSGRNFDIVILDLAVPDGAGLGNVALVRAAAPHVPVIVAGESDDETLALEAVHAGAHDYLVKSQLNPGWLQRSLRYSVERHRLDHAVLQAEEKYHSLFDNLVEGIFQTTADGRYLLANAALARIYGYASPDELRATLTDISHRLYVQEGRRDEFVRLMQQYDTLTNFESPVHRKDGSIIWISESCRAIRDAQGNLLYYEGTVEDVTQRREAEEKVQRSEALYHSLVETLPQNIVRKDPQGRFTFANQQFCKSLGRPLEEIVGKTDYDFFPPDLAAKYQRDDQRVLRTGKPFETVEEHQPPGGRKMFVQVVKTPLYGPDGKAIGLQAIFWDITRQRQADEKIRRANSALAKSRRELHARNAQMEDDLKMAREIQLTLLPQQYPAFPRPGAQPGSVFEFTHRYLPTGSVGGDFFTVSALSETQAAVFVCDVAGHGVRAALITAMVRALVEELKPFSGDPGPFLTKLNADLCAILKHIGTPLLTTAFYLVADSQTGGLRFANAGHPKPFHIRRAARQVVPLSSQAGKSQPALGLFDNAQYQGSETHLEPSDLVMLFTDGLVEVQNRTGELYNPAHLTTVLEQRLHRPAGEVLDALLDDARKFSDGAGFTDDVCLVGMEFTG